MTIALPEPAAVETIGGRPVPLHYGAPVAEERALRDGSALVERGHRARVSLAGEKAAELLTGLVTNDVQALAPGHGQYAAVLTPKGKIVADVRIFVGAGQADRILVDTGARAGDGLLGVVRKYVNPRVAPYRDEREALDVLGVFGPRSRSVVASVTGVGLETLSGMPVYSHRAADVEGAHVVVARVPELLVEGYELFVPRDAADALRTRLAQAGVAPAGLLAWETARIEAGRPEWGIDMDENTLPQEANFDELNAISYTKGCYTGQETVARVHFRGHVNRHLRHLRFEGDALPPTGAALADDAGKAVGEVRSVVRSPRLGAIAIGMVRREVVLGTMVAVRWEGGETRATVYALPYVTPVVAA